MKPSAFCEGLRGFSETSRGDNDARAGAACGHDAKEFPDNGYAHTSGLPLLALNDRALAVLRQHQVDTSVRPSSAGLCDHVAAKPVRLAYKHLKLAPRHVLQDVSGIGVGDLVNQSGALTPRPGRKRSPGKTNDGNGILPDAGERDCHHPHE